MVIFMIIMVFENFNFSYRTYVRAIDWRNGNEGRADSFLFTKTYNRPLDVPSDEEPEMEPGLEQWQGHRVTRRQIRDEEWSTYLGMLFMAHKLFLGRKL